MSAAARPSAASNGANPFQELIDRQRAARPRNELGEPICTCGAFLGPEGFACATCLEGERVAERKRALDAEIHAGLELTRATLLPWDWAKGDDPLFLERVRSTKLRALAAKWTPARGPILLLGESGLGKTTTAAAIVHRLISEGESAARAAGTTRRCGPYELASRIRWTSAPRLIAARRGHPLGHGECPEWVSASGAHLLVIDELGQEQADPRWLFELLNERSYRRGRLTTVSTSGLTRTALEIRFGSGAVRRLVEPGGNVLDLHGGSSGG